MLAGFPLCFVRLYCAHVQPQAFCDGAGLAVEAKERIGTAVLQVGANELAEGESAHYGFPLFGDNGFPLSFALT